MRVRSESESESVLEGAGGLLLGVENDRSRVSDLVTCTTVCTVNSKSRKAESQDSFYVTIAPSCMFGRSAKNGAK